MHYTEKPYSKSTVDISSENKKIKKINATSNTENLTIEMPKLSLMSATGRMKTYQEPWYFLSYI